MAFNLIEPRSIITADKDVFVTIDYMRLSNVLEDIIDKKLPESFRQGIKERVNNAICDMEKDFRDSYVTSLQKLYSKYDIKEVHENENGM